jgi:signal transduction histidine kinase
MKQGVTILEDPHIMATTGTGQARDLDLAAHSQRVKILLVDDRPANLLALETILEDLGQELVKATSGKDALRQILNEDFAVILLDVKMPGMDGFETATLIRERERSRHTPILFITAHKDDEHLFRGYYAGAVDFLYKPINPEVLRSKVAVFVDLSRKTELLQKHAAILEARNAELERSILERRRADEEVRRLNCELEQRVADRTAELVRANEELRQFGYAASHDLREPLRTVASYTQLLTRRYAGQLDDEGREFMGYITDSVHRMDALLSDLLAYSHQLNVRQQVLSPVDTEAVLQGVLLNLDVSIRESGSRIESHDLPEVMSDFAQMGQVFQNLIGNAIKYRGAEPPFIEIWAEESEDVWTFCFRDNGLGINPRYHDQIFGIFKRLHGREYPGTGIGLALVKRIIERHNGRIWVESEDGKGSTFKFTIPK